MSAAQTLADAADAGTCHTARDRVDDLSDCSYAAVHALNGAHVHPLVQQLVKTAFFRYFKVCEGGVWWGLLWRGFFGGGREGSATASASNSVPSLSTQNQHHPPPTHTHTTKHTTNPQVNIYCDCPLWPDDSMCMQRACSVCECGKDEVPMPWLAAEQVSKIGGSCWICWQRAAPDLLMHLCTQPPAVSPTI
jgi:hypothetical protein